MAWVIKLSLLLAVLVRSILTYHVIRTEGDDYNFNIPGNSEYCLFYRSSAEENLLLWNTSKPSPENSTLTAEFRGRLRLRKDRSIINNLTQSDSGQYRIECWRNDSETDQDTRDLLVCSRYNGRKDLYVDYGQTVELQCEGARDDDTMTVMWYEWRKQLSESSVLLNVTMRGWIIPIYQCALMEERLCVSYQDFNVNMQRNYVVVSMGEEAVLSCFNHDDPNGTETRWDTSSYTLKWDPSFLSRTEKQMYVTDGRTTGNYSLVFTSLMLNDTRWYRCRSTINTLYTLKIYYFLVFLKSESDLLTEFFSELEQVVLRCNSIITEYDMVVWFRRTAEGEHVFLHMYDKQLLYMAQKLDGRINASQPGSFLVLSNLTLKDTGEYWCGLFYKGVCVSVTKTLLLEWDPFGINSTLYRMYSTLMGCALLGMVCALILKTRGRDQVSLKTRRRDQASLKTSRSAARTQRQRSSRVEQREERSSRVDEEREERSSRVDEEREERSSRVEEEREERSSRVEEEREERSSRVEEEREERSSRVEDEKEEVAGQAQHLDTSEKEREQVVDLL